MTCNVLRTIGILVRKLGLQAGLKQGLKNNCPPWRFAPSLKVGWRSWDALIASKFVFQVVYKHCFTPRGFLPQWLRICLGGKRLCRRRSHSLMLRTTFPWFASCRSMAGAGTVQGTSASSRTNPGSTPPRSRTVCQPVFTAPNVPINPQATGVPSCILDGSELQAKKLSSCTWDDPETHRFELPLKCYMIYALVFGAFVQSDVCVPGYLLSACLPSPTRFRWWSPTSHWPCIFSTRPMRPSIWKVGNSLVSTLEASLTKL